MLYAAAINRPWSRIAVKQDFAISSSLRLNYTITKTRSVHVGLQVSFVYDRRNGKKVGDVERRTKGEKKREKEIFTIRALRKYEHFCDGGTGSSILFR